MLSLSSLVDFLLDLLRDEDAAQEFSRDPQGTLARHGLDGVTAQDISDVQPLLADCSGVVYRPAPSAAPDDTVGAIRHVTRTHHHDGGGGGGGGGGGHHHHHHHDATQQFTQYNNAFSYTDNSVVMGDGSVYVRDSFNQDNDGIDTKGGTVTGSNLVNGDDNDTGNQTETTVVDDSFNEETTTDTDITDSGNETTTDTTEIVESFNDTDVSSVADSSTTATVSINDSFAPDAAAATVDEGALAGAGGDGV